MDGIPSTTEIISKQLAFPGVKLDDIHHCTFITQMWGEWTPYKTTNSSVTAWGMFPSCHYNENGNIDKLAVQFGILDGENTKGVILVFTNGDEGVYVERFGRYYKTAKKLGTKLYTMADDGSISQARDNKGQLILNEWVPDDGGVGYRASGIKIHGMSPVNTKLYLAFPGANLAMLKNLGVSDYMAGYRIGKDTEVPATDNVANYLGYWPTSGEIEKIAVQFTHPNDANKVAVIELTDGVGGVYARHVLSTYGKDEKCFKFDENGEIVKAAGTAGASGAYPIEEFHIKMQELPPCVTKTPNKIKVWSSGNAAAPLTLEDIRYGKFTARMCGSYLPASFRDTPNSAVGYNKKIYKDEAGNVTSIIVEFQVEDGGYVKCLVVSFENGEDGIYAKAINARCSSEEEIGFTFRDYEKNLYGNANNSSKGEIFAETFAAEGYGVFDLRVVMPAGFIMLVK